MLLYTNIVPLLFHKLKARSSNFLSLHLQAMLFPPPKFAILWLKHMMKDIDDEGGSGQNHHSYYDSN